MVDDQPFRPRAGQRHTKAGPADAKSGIKSGLASDVAWSIGTASYAAKDAAVRFLLHYGLW
jgi:hypothetical protein